MLDATEQDVTDAPPSASIHRRSIRGWVSAILIWCLLRGREGAAGLSGSSTGFSGCA